MNIFIGPLLLILLVTIEFLVIKFIRKEEIPWNEVSMNLNSGHILMWFFRGGELFAFISCSFYWFHRLHHKIKLLWYVYEVHHQGEHFRLNRQKLGCKMKGYYTFKNASINFIFLPIDNPL